MFQTYDVERGEGASAAEKYRVSGVPTLIVLDADGHELVRANFEGPAWLPGWLKGSARATAPEPELRAQVKAHPNDVATMWLLVKRAQLRKDSAGVRAWLARIEAADKSPGRVEAARAAWQRGQAEIEEGVKTKLRAFAMAQLAKYPAHGQDALHILCATGADPKLLDREYARVVDATDDPAMLNALTYEALAVGALDAALHAAQKQAQATPDDPNVYDSLAEAYHYRGEHQKAVETEQKGLAMKDVPPELAAAMKHNLARFQRGSGPSPDVRMPPGISSPFDPKMAPPPHQPSAREAARTLYAHQLGTLGQACGAEAKGLDEAYVRVVIGERSAVDKVEVLEPAASPALRKCLDKAVRAIALPADSDPTRVTFAIPFSSGGA